MLFQIPAGYIIDKIGEKKSLIFSAFISIIFFLVVITAFFFWQNNYGFVLIPMLIAGEVLFSLRSTTFIPSQMTIQTDLDEKKRAESYGIAQFMIGFGEMPAAIIAGFLIANIHYISPFLITLGGMIFEIWFLTKYLQNDDKKDEITFSN
jgi:MFS family permease